MATLLVVSLSECILPPAPEGADPVSGRSQVWSAGAGEPGAGVIARLDGQGLAVPRQF